MEWLAQGCSALGPPSPHDIDAEVAQGHEAWQRHSPDRACPVAPTRTKAFPVPLEHRVHKLLRSQHHPIAQVADPQPQHLPSAQLPPPSAAPPGSSLDPAPASCCAPTPRSAAAVLCGIQLKPLTMSFPSRSSSTLGAPSHCPHPPPLHTHNVGTPSDLPPNRHAPDSNQCRTPPSAPPSGSPPPAHS